MTSEPLTVEELEHFTGTHWLEYFPKSIRDREEVSAGQAREFARSYAEALLKVYSRQLWLEAPWISVSERLPEQGVWVLVAHSDGGRFTDHIGEDGEWADAPWLTTHWTPIPPLTPKAESTPKPSPALPREEK